MDRIVIERALEKVHTYSVGRITKLNEDHSVCSIKLLKKITFNGKEEVPPILDNVPIMQIFDSPVVSISSAYKEKGKVLVAFFDGQHDEALNAKEITGSSRKDRFNINDCFVERPIKENSGEKNPDPGDFFIKNKISGEVFRMKSSGGGEYIGNLHVDGELTASGEIIDGNGYKVSREHRYYDDGNPMVTEPLSTIKMGVDIEWTFQ